MKAKKLLPLIALALSASTFAGDWYVAGSMGQSNFDSKKSDADAVLVGLGATALSSTLSKTDTAYKFQVGYQLNQNFSVEGGYIDLGKTKYSATYTGGAATAQIKASGWNIAGVGTLPLGNNFSLIGKLGLIDAKVEASGSVTGLGATVAPASDTSWKTTWGFGAAYAINKNLSVRGEYDHFDKLGSKNKTGEGDVDLWSVGLVYKF